VVKDVGVRHACPFRHGGDSQPSRADFPYDLFRCVQDRRVRFFDGSTRSHCHGR
jgi:hypothetical protein